MLLSTMGGQAIAPFVPLYAQTLGLGTGTIGLLVGAGGATALAASLLAGTLLGSAGPRRLVLVGAAATAVGLTAVGTWPSVVVLVVVLPLVSAMQAIMATVLTGLGIGLAFPITMVMVSEGATGNRVGRRLSARFVTMMLGGVLGPSVTGLAAGWSLVGALGGVAGVGAATGVIILSAHRRQAFLDTRKSAMLR